MIPQLETDRGLRSAVREDLLLRTLRINKWCAEIRTRRMTQPASSHASMLATLFLCAVAPAAAMADDPVRLTLKDHRFVPTEVSVPADQRFRIEVVNQDPTPAEFESSDLRAEKIVVPGGTITVLAGPLKPGTYTFFDDYNPDQAKGTLTATASHAGE
jgi:hypothetical protein